MRTEPLQQNQGHNRNRSPKRLARLVIVVLVNLLLLPAAAAAAAAVNHSWLPRLRGPNCVFCSCSSVHLRDLS